MEANKMENELIPRTRQQWIRQQIERGNAVAKIFQVPKECREHRFQYIRNNCLLPNEIIVQYAAFPAVIQQKTGETHIKMTILIKQRERKIK
jgi:hypothetical protein